MTATRVLHNDDEYIDGLLDSSPAIIEAIYKRFSRKVSSFILQHGGILKDAAHIFEVALVDIYNYAHRQPLDLTNRFEPFFMLICKEEWRRELQKKGMAATEEAAPEMAALDNTHLKYVRELTAEGEKKRYWLHVFHQLPDDCQEAVSKALIRPLPDGANKDPQPTAGLLPGNFASCMSALVRNSLAGRPALSLPPASFEQAALYVVQALPESEREPFEAKLGEEPRLKEALRQTQEAADWLGRALTPDNTRRELGQLLIDQRQTWFYGKDRSMNKMGVYVMLITVVAVCMASLLFISPWRKDIYRQFSSTEMVHSHITTNDTSRLLHQAAQHFNRQRYTRAIHFLNQVLEKDAGNAYARYYRGICLLELNQLNAGRTDLQTVYESPSAFRYDAAFYLALSYMKEQNKQQSMDWLLKIPDQAPVHWKAKRLLDEVK